MENIYEKERNINENVNEFTTQENIKFKIKFYLIT